MDATQTQTVDPKATVQAAPPEDLVTRQSKVSITPIESKTEQDTIFNVKDFEKIQDPMARKVAEDAYKSMQADYTRKTQAIATEKKNLESLKQQLESSGQYTPDKIQSMLSDPSFVRAAQEFQRINGGQSVQRPNMHGNADLSDEEFSYLSPEQQKLYVKTKQMEQSMGIINTRLQAAEVEKEDMSLKSKYANYDTKSVNEIYEGMMSGRIQATREHLWKVQDYDSAVQRAYELGRQDRKLELGEKVNASSQANGVSVTQSEDVPVRLPHESGVEYFKRIAMSNFNKTKK